MLSLCPDFCDISVMVDLESKYCSANCKYAKGETELSLNKKSYNSWSFYFLHPASAPPLKNTIKQRYIQSPIQYISA